MREPDWRRTFMAAVMLLEDIVESGIAVAARIGGLRHPVIVPFVGHGTPTRARVGARLVRGRKAAPPSVAPEATSRRSRRAVLRTGLARFVLSEMAKAEVTIHAPGGDVVVRTNRDGYVDHEVSLPGVAPGWLEIGLTGPGDSRATANVLVVDPAVEVGVISDVDDTILHTGLSRGLDFLRATLLTDVADRTPLAGAAALYRALAAPGRPVFYVSTSPWNLHEMLLQFMALRGFPPGPLLLTDWGPSHTGLFRIGAQAHKPAHVQRLLDEHPDLRWVLVGDSGQEDPEIYGAIAREHPARVAAVYIRRTAGIPPERAAGLDVLAGELAALGVPMVAVDDSGQIAEHAAGLGLLDAAAVARVRAEPAA